MHSRSMPGRPAGKAYSIGIGLGQAFTLALVTLGFWSCVETYSDTRMQANLWVGSKLERSSLVAPVRGLRPGDPGYFSHYEMYATLDGSGMARLKTFIIQPAVDVENPCLQFIPEVYCVDAEYPCDPWLNIMRWEALERMYVLASPQVTLPVPPGFSAYGYDHYPGYDFTQWPDPLFLNPSLTPDASKLDRSNLRREVVERFCGNCLPEGYYLGNPMGVSEPIHGEVYGIVDGPDPRSGVGIGGIFLRVPGKLRGLEELLIIRERDPSRLSAENYHRTDILPGEHGQVFLVGQRDGEWGSISDREVWGVTTVSLENPYGLPVFMRVVIFGEIEKDPVGI